MYLPNQINDQFQKQMNRPATDYEVGVFKNVSPDQLSSIGSTYGKLNKDSSITDYLKFNGIDPNTRTQLASQHGISNIGTAEGNTNLLNTLKNKGTTQTAPNANAGNVQIAGSQIPTQNTPPQATGQPQTQGNDQALYDTTTGKPTPYGLSQGAQEYRTPQSGITEAYTDPNNQKQQAQGIQNDKDNATTGGSISTAANPTSDAPQPDPATEPTRKQYTDVQNQIASIDRSLSEELEAKKKQIIQSGGIVNEAQLRGEVNAERAPLLSQRSNLVAQQRTLGQQYQSLLSSNKAAKADFDKQQSLNEKQREFNTNQSNKQSNFAMTEADKAKMLAEKQNVDASNKNYKTGSLALGQQRLTQNQSQFEKRIQSQKDLVTLKASLSGSNQGISDELAQAIQSGKIDGQKVNSRNIKLYNDLAKMNVDVVKSSLSIKRRNEIVAQATKYQTSSVQMAGILEKNMPTLIDLAGKVNTSMDSNAINAAFIKGTAYASSDKNVAAYVTALINARTEYANLVARGGQATESTREEATQAIPAGYTPDEYQAVLDTELSNASNSYDASTQIIDQAMNNDTSGPTKANWHQNAGAGADASSPGSSGDSSFNF